VGAYLISPSEPSAWAIQPEALADAMRRDWPEALVRSVPERPSAPGPVTFDIGFADETLSGYLARSGQALWCERGSVRAASAVAVWFRDMAPSGLMFVFGDEEGETEVVVPHGADAAAIADAYEFG
jgi:hypothetical protein